MSTNPTGARDRLAAARQRCAALLRIRPQSLATPLIKLFAGYERRMIVPVEGMSLYLDPLSHLAGTILAEGTFEASTIALFRQEVRPGDTVLDIGANEGFFSALAAGLAGPDGTVIAIEPQQRLQDVLHINLALNRVGTSHILHCAIGAPAESSENAATQRQIELSLAPPGNTGATSILNRYRWGAGTESVALRTVTEILDSLQISDVGFVKVDVEGYESAVIPSLMPLLQSGRIRSLLLDYHASILRQAGIDPQPLHGGILAAGYSVINRERDGLDGYVLYRRSAAG
jgi:FkbM family methyltransferase